VQVNKFLDRGSKSVRIVRRTKRIGPELSITWGVQQPRTSEHDISLVRFHDV
jgi:hypothetical protein